MIKDGGEVRLVAVVQGAGAVAVSCLDRGGDGAGGLVGNEILAAREQIDGRDLSLAEL